MKKKKLIRTIALALGLVSVSALSPVVSQTGGIFTQQEARADDTRPMFDASGYVTINGIKYVKTGDTTVAVNHGEDYDALTINIPAQISVNDVRYNVTSIQSNAFMGEVLNSNVYKTYSATTLNLPKSITSIGDLAFYSLVNVESLDFSQLQLKLYGGTSYIAVSPVDTRMDVGNKLNRIKLGIFYAYNSSGGYYYPIVDYAGVGIGAQDIANKLAVFKDEAGNLLSQWALNPQVTRINELQDAPVKDGYTFTGWGSKSDNYSYANLIVYTPQYVQGQPIWDFEDRVNALLAETPVSQSTTQADMQRVIDTCKTYDNISYTISNFRVVPPQWGVRGAVRFTINTTNATDGSTSTLDVDKYTTALPATGDVNNYLSMYAVTEATTQQDVITYLSKKLNDIGLDVSIDNFSNTGKIVSGTVVVKNKLTGESQSTKFSRAIEAQSQAVVTDTLDTARINNSTTPDDINKYLQSVLGEGYSIDTSSLTNKDGKVTGDIIVTTPSGSKITIPVSETVPARTETVTDATTAVNTAVPNLSLTNSTTAQDIVDQINKTVTDPSLVVTVSPFTNKDGKITGSIVITDVDTKETKTIPLSAETEASKVTDTISNTPVSAKTTESDIANAIAKTVDPTTTVVIKDFANDGKTITGTVVTTDKNGNTTSTPISIPIVSQSASDVATLVKKNMMSLVPTATTTQQDVYALLTRGIKDANVLVLLDNFTNDGKVVTGDITVSKTGETDQAIKLSKTISGATTSPTDGTTPGGSTSPSGTTPSGTSGSGSNTNTNSVGNSSFSGNTFQGGTATSSVGNITVSPQVGTNTNTVTVNPTIGNTTVTNGNITVSTGGTTVTTNK